MSVHSAAASIRFVTLLNEAATQQNELACITHETAFITEQVTMTKASMQGGANCTCLEALVMQINVLFQKKTFGPRLHPRNPREVLV